jgi:hypothetical protein
LLADDDDEFRLFLLVDLGDILIQSIEKRFFIDYKMINFQYILNKIFTYRDIATKFISIICSVITNQTIGTVNHAVEYAITSNTVALRFNEFKISTNGD